MNYEPKYSRKGPFEDNCSTLDVAQMRTEGKEGYDCMPYDKSRHCLVNTAECLKLIDEGKIKTKFVGGTEIINEAGFKDYNYTGGYGKYFPSTDIVRKLS